MRGTIASFAGLLMILPVTAAAQPSMSVLPESVLSPLDAARKAMLSDSETAFQHAVRAERSALSIQATNQRRVALANARWLGGEALIRLDRATAASRLVESAGALASVSGDLKLFGDIQLTRGGILAHEVRVADALGAYQAAHATFIKAGDARGQAIALQSIANLYTDGRDFTNAERYYRQAEEAFPDDPILTLALYNNRAAALLTQERYKDAVVELQRALTLARDRGMVPIQARILGNLANAYIELGELSLGQAAIRSAEPLVARPEARGARLQIVSAAAQLALQRGDVSTARRLVAGIFEGVDLSTTNAAFRDAHVNAYEVYRASGDSAAALSHLQALRRLTDQETRLAASTNTALMAARFDFANQELRIARLKAEELRASVALERSRAQFQRTLTLGVVGGAIVIVGLLSFGIVTLRRSRNRVREANIELEASNTALAKALAAKTEFLATTSHEIRTPLNGILGMTQVMLADAKLPAAQRGRVEVVHGAGLTMRALVDDILDVAKMETGNLSIAPEPVDMRTILSEVAQMWSEQARAKGLDFDLDIADAPGWIVTDAARVRQIVFNLMGNALKFTADGSIGLAACVDGDGHNFRLMVSDTGIGIPPEKHEQIFESFRQADSTTTRQFGGTGLGLTICRNLARALGGTISVESREGAGSTFTVSLPLVAVEAPVEQAAAVVEGEALILVESNPIARSILRTILMPHCSEIVIADNVDAGLEALSQRDRFVVDSAALGEEDAARLACLADVVRAAAERGADSFVLWKEPSEIVVARTQAMEGVTLIPKPIAGPDLIGRLFGVRGDPNPLVTEAA